MRLIVRDTAQDASAYVAEYIIRRIQEFDPTPEKPFVLGLPTGSSPETIYKILVREHKAGIISFKNVITFNMDEYVGIPRDHPESYHSFMYKHFFSHVDVLPQNINILNGNAPDLKTECEEYEARIKTVGGIELFLGGIGPDGHVAFNEPGSSLTSRTRVKTLAEDTIRANSRFFDNDMSKVPRMALTVGIQTVLDAREVAIIITGAHKSLALQRCIEGGVNHMWTLSALQMHPQTLIAVDEDATLELQVKTVKYFKSIEHVQLSSTSHAANTVTTPSTTSNPKPLTLNTSNRDPNPADPEDLTPDSMSSRILTASPTQTQPQFQTGTKSKQDFASKRDRQQSIDSAIGGFGFSTPVSASVRSNDGEEAEDSSPLEGKGNGSTNGGRVRFSNVVV